MERSIASSRVVLGVVVVVLGVLFTVINVVDARENAETIETGDDCDASWRRGRANATHTLVRFNNHVRRALNALTTTEAWEKAEMFMRALDGALGESDADFAVLHEFNALPRPTSLDVSIRLEYYGMKMSGVLERLATCDERWNGEGRSCMGLERSKAFATTRRWWKKLRDEYADGHPYWVGEYLEFDMSEDGMNPTASVFIEHTPGNTGRHDEFVPGVREYLAAVGAETSETLFVNAQRVVDLATADGFDTSIWAAGIMFSRALDASSARIDSVRVLIYFNRHVARNDAEREEDGYASEKTRQMVRLLESLHWTGDYDEFDRIDDLFPNDGGVGSVLQVDVLAREPTADDPSIIGPRVGVEITVAQMGLDNQVVNTLASKMVSAGLAEKSWWLNFTAALCGTPTRDAYNSRSPLYRPCFIKRRTAADKVELLKPSGEGLLPPISISASHFKFIVQPGRPLYAKAYVGSQHAFKYCVDSDSTKIPHTAPTYNLCRV